jgi:hypothetical protein
VRGSGTICVRPDAGLWISLWKTGEKMRKSESVSGFAWSPGWALAHRLKLIHEWPEIPWDMRGDAAMRVVASYRRVRLACSFEWERDETLPLRLVPVPQDVEKCPTCVLFRPEEPDGPAAA